MTGIATEAFVAIWEQLLVKTVAFVRPDAIVVSAGFDYVKGDPVGDLGVDVDAAASLAAAINRVAAIYAGGRAAYVLEGGYDIDDLTESIAQVIAAKNEGDDVTGADSAAIPAPQQRSLDRVASCLS